MLDTLTLHTLMLDTLMLDTLHSLRRRGAAIILIGCACGLATAQDQPRNQPAASAFESVTDIERRLRGLVGMLDDGSWVVREQSTRMIGDPNEGFELDMLARTLQRGDLSVEARVRLRQAARSLFAQSTKAGLGVGFGVMRDGGIEIGTVVKDVDRFPAAGMLIPGDLIVGAEGMPLTSSEDLRAMILSHAPGETLNLMIQRGGMGANAGRVLDMDLPLGSYKLLRGAAPINARIADRAIEIRWARQGVTLPSPNTVGGEITADEWINAGYPDEPGSFRASNARRTPHVVSAGSSRDVFVGVGTIVRGRIEPWSNRTNAQIAMDQAKRIELSQQMNMARMQVQLFTNAVKMLEDQLKRGLGGDQIKTKLSRATKELRAAQKNLDELTEEFDSIPGTP